MRVDKNGPRGFAAFAACFFLWALLGFAASPVIAYLDGTQSALRLVALCFYCAVLGIVFGVLDYFFPAN